MANGNGKKKCFVVMGFGEKTDYYSNPQRVLNLNRTFENIIEPAVTDAGLECIRADKIIHSGVIDKPMYDNLLEADVVIADLSTSNVNAIYELGVRHALRPHATIIIAENQFAFPFDLNHVAITQYEHLGKDIGFSEVMRVRGVLQTKIKAIVDNATTDSPVFMFLPQLLGDKPGAPAPAPMAAPQDDKSLAELLETFREEKKNVKEPEDWLTVAAVLRRLQKLQPSDPYIVQQLALATYKSKQPDAATSLRKAKTILDVLKPDTSVDAETVGLWGAIHKRLWEIDKKMPDLNTAVRSYARGFFIKDDYYNGINFAFLLNVRAANSTGDDTIADRVVARRIRREVLTICDIALSGTLNDDDRFWVNASKVEALTGLGLQAEADTLQAAISAGVDQWKLDTMNGQLAALKALNP
jgi:hypothetical protein